MKELRDLLERRPPGEHEVPPFVATFIRGLSLGALVGAAIAGSAIWRRLREDAGPREDAGRPEDAGPPEDVVPGAVATPRAAATPGAALTAGRPPEGRT